MKLYDKVIIGAGLYGLYSALFSGKRGEKVVVLERDSAPFMRATYINQARVHMGYHYPRSLSTACKSANYFKRFMDDFDSCILTSFDQVYATSSKFSWTNAEQFVKFCDHAGIRCDEVRPNKYFKEEMCDGAFLTEEYTYDAMILKDFFLSEIARYPNIEIVCDADIISINKEKDHFEIKTANGIVYGTSFLLNATYASTNQISDMLDFPSFKIKYELCEIILCDVNKKLEKTGITVMDGPFFSIMPFGLTGQHSLTAVTFTPHSTSYEDLPSFQCQMRRTDGKCRSNNLMNCNECQEKPETAWAYMSGLARKYLRDDMGFSYKGSLFSMKPILKASEIDDSRPTVIRKFCENPTYVAVLSGKINTVYDMDEVLTNG